MPFDLKLIVNNQIIEDMTVRNCADCPLSESDKRCGFSGIARDVKKYTTSIHRDCTLLTIKHPPKKSLKYIPVALMEEL